MLDGNEAVAFALRLARVRVIATYPITPQSPIAEKLADYVADGSLPARYIRVESEHSALAAAIGAQLTGVRAATATSSVGLALMHEVLGVASGCRIPLVMPVVNRSLVSPWSLWCDHQDAMSVRDAGWLQFYAGDNQEVLDWSLMAYRVAEDPRVWLPAMVCLDGFFLSHAGAVVLVPDPEEVDAFLPPYRSRNLRLDPADPMFVNDLTPPAEFTEMRYQQQLAMENAPAVLDEAAGEFARLFGRRCHAVEGYALEDAEAVVVTMGSMSGTARYVVDEMRAGGRRVGAVQVRVFRPFPGAALRRLLAGRPAVGVVDRSAGMGAEGGPLWTEVRCALAGVPDAPVPAGFVAGLGGRDIPPATLEKVFDRLLAGEPANNVWIDVGENPLGLREVTL